MKEVLNELKSFIHECLLFQSKETENALYGAAMWAAIVLFVHSIIGLLVASVN